MQLDDPMFKPSKIEGMTSLHPDTLRDWRRLRILDHYGKANVSGRWMYSLRDAIGLWIAGVLTGTDGLRGAMLLRARDLAPAIAARVIADEEGSPAPNKRFVGGVYVGALEDGEDGSIGESWEAVDTLAELDRFEGAHEFRFLDLKTFADTVPADLRAAILEARKAD